jgi:glutaredoxin
MSMLRACLLSLLALSFSAAAQTLYKWVDKDGKVHYSDQPPPKEVKKVEQPRLRSGSIDTGDLPFETQQAARNFPVTLYTTPDCVSECANARDLLNRRGIPFSENSVVTVEQGDSFKKALGTDKLLFPALIVGTQKQIGFEADIWHGLLDVAGYPRTAVPGRTPRPGAEGAPAGR